MHSTSWWIEWPIGLLRVGVVFLVTTAVIAVLVVYPRLLDELGDDASRNSALGFADREIAGGNGLAVDQQAVYAARGLIPEDATYHVAVDPDFQGGTALTREQVGTFYRYFLLPRREAENAPWIVCYGCDLAEYDGVNVLWADDEGVSIAQVQP
jgi:hypothetical protein